MPTNPSPKYRLNSGLFAKGAEAGGSGKSLLSRLGSSLTNLGSPAKRSSPKLGARRLSRENSGLLVSPSKRRSGAAFHNVAKALAAAAATEPALVVQFGFVPGLVALMRPGAATDSCVIAAANALASIAQHSREHHAHLRESGLLPVLLQMLTSTRASASIVLAALEVLRPLSRDADAKEMLREAGAFKPLLAQLEVPPTLEAAEAAACRKVAEVAVGVVRNLATSPTNQDALRTAGAIKVLVCLIAVSEEHAEASPPPARSEGSGDGHGQEKMRNINASYEVLGPGHPDGARGGFVLGSKAAATAATALANLAVANQANKTAIRQANGIPGLVHMLGCGQDCAAAAVEALGNLSVKNKDNKDAIRVAGGVAKMCQQYRNLRPLQSNRPGPAASLKKGSSGTTAAAPADAAPADLSDVASILALKAEVQSAPSAAAAPRSVGWVGAARPPTAPPSLPIEALDGASSTAGPAVPLDPNAAEHEGPKSPASPAYNAEAAAERLGWALRNLTAGNGLNAAVVTSSGLALKDLESLRSPKPEASPTKAEEAEKVKISPPPRPSAEPQPSAMKPGFGASRRALAEVEVGATSGEGDTAPMPEATALPPPEIKTDGDTGSKIHRGKKGATGRLAKASKSGRTTTGGEEAAKAAPSPRRPSAGIGLTAWARGRAP